MTADVSNVEDVRHALANRLAIDGGEPVRTTPLPWELPGAHWIGEEERELVERVVLARSPFRFYGLDPQHMVDTLEREWCEAYGHKHALAVSSGTAALAVAVAALGIGPGDEVLIPGYLWVSCVSAVVRNGAIPRLVDMDATYCMDPEDVARKIGPHTRAVLCVHMSGAPGHIARIAGICKARGVSLIEDCAQAAGARVKDTAVGRFGDIGIFSFQLNKNMTSGDGGMIVCEDDALFRRIVALHDLGYPRTPAGRLDVSDAQCQLWGMGARMSELAGAMALAQSRKLPAITGAMRGAKWAIRKAVEGIAGLTFREVPDPDGDTGPTLLMLLPDGETASAFIAALRAEGIAGPPGSLSCITMREWGLHWYFNIPSLVNRRSNARDGFPWSHPSNAFAADYDYGHGALPVCDDVHARGVLLTISSNLAEQDIRDIVHAIRKVAAGLLR
ncbi:8-amino-3,8-dideoxy-alpha-D-manno-octulosonate transaminase [Azorhizobium oxalatiphilum]|uniref:8-amino-3,8-dideoxy-alpha-D-manno-octulosonate transaminase n=1 Tax=Azorhizobium oxalatiphilum TaxID=980631 RepID=A0A917C8R4_9HYPH|nr:aminotransferase class I/II-fold pyridoxal phosphate-dependent enzyme [Azorhizobium oxalatiphilum]GGF75224.1 8-amino-3,8-dideoxy-alpha-D-manno-octulosonate transaminase [Azorhizobium oxalatiphilum]